MIQATPVSVLSRLLSAVLMIVLLSACGGKRSEQYRQEGDLLFSREKYDEAKADYLKALAADAENALAQYGLGRCLEEEDDLAGALDAYNLAIELEPTLTEAYAYATGVLMRQIPPDNEAALAMAERLGTQDVIQGAILRSVVLRGMNRIEEATAILEAQRDSTPDSKEIRLTLATLYLETDKAPEAETELRYLLDNLDSKHNTARALLIEACRRQEGKTDEMVAEFEELVNENPDSVPLREGFARVLLYAQRYADAEALAIAIIESEPNSLWANYVAGLTMLQRNATEEATPHLEAALSLVPEEENELRAEITTQLEKIRDGNTGTQPDPGVEIQIPAPVDSTKLGWQELWQRADLLNLVNRREEFLAEGGPLVRETILLAALFSGNVSVANEVAADLDENSTYVRYLNVLESKELEQLLALFSDWTENQEETEKGILRENALGYACGRAGARNQAMNVLQNAYTSWPENAVSLYNLAMIFRQSGQPRYAARALQTLLRQYAGNLDIQLLLFDTLREAGLKREAQNIASITYVQFNTSPQAVLNFAEALLDQREIEFTKTLFEKALSNLPDNTDLLTAEAAFDLRLGDVEGAATTLDSIETSASSDVIAAKAMLAAAQDNWDSVFSQTDLIPLEERSIGIKLLAAAAHGKTGNFNAAQEQLLSVRATSSFWTQPLGTAIRDAFKLPNAESNEFAQQLQSSDSARADFLAGAAFEVLGQTRLASETYISVESTLPRADMITQHIFRVLTNELDKDAAESTAKEVLARHTDDAESQLAYARMCYAFGELGRVGDAINKAVEADPQSANAWTNLGRFKEQENEIEAALEAYRTALKYAPDDAVVNNNLAYLLLQTNGDPNEALNYAAKAYELRSGSADILHTLGLAQLEAGELEESNKSLRLAIEFRPGEPTILLDYGRLLITMGEKEQGLDHIRKAIGYAESLGLDFPRISQAREILEENAPEPAEG